MKQHHQDFWNFRGSFKIAKVVDIGTQMSLVRRANGRFLVLDSYDIDDADRTSLLGLTEGGRLVDAIINVHPFHTLHCTALAKLLPDARLIGTARHRDEVSELQWEQGVIEDPATQAEFAEDLEFSVPDGLDFVPDDDSVHSASVLVRHKPSRIVHVDDTIMVLAPPSLIEALLPEPRMRFHPALSKALKKEPGAADAYANWARRIAAEWADTPLVCAAHSAARELPPGGWSEEILEALDKVEKVLDKHRAEHG